jgi:hypothetical protein
MYGCGAGLAVTGAVRDIGQNVLVCFCNRNQQQQKHRYCHVFFRIALLEEACVRNTIIIPYINYIIIIGIKNNYGRLRGLILLLRFPRAGKGISLKFIKNMSTCPLKGSPALN